MRARVRESCADAEVPPEVLARLRGRLEAEPEPRSDEGMLRVVLMRPRVAIPLAVAAAALLWFGPGSRPVEEAAAQGAAMSPVLRDVVRLHSSALPLDVSAPPDVSAPLEEQVAPEEQVARYFRGKLEFPVRPARFERQDVRLVGARLSNVRERRAAALYYDVRGHRVTMVVFDAPIAERGPGILSVRMRGREVFYQDVQGYTVPVRRHGGLSYAFAGDLDRRALFELAATAHVPR